MDEPLAVSRLNASLAGRYRIEGELGEGGMATVYLAHDIRHDRHVALKVLKPALAAMVGADRFLAEIATTARLQHPHILPLFDSGNADGFLFYVMPYVEGPTLRERLDGEEQLPVEEALAIATAAAGALQAAHEAGVVHRDIKPANILLGRGGALVADFGIALAVGSADAVRLTETGLSIGTLQYMSPEQAAGDQEVGPSSDTFALACVLYEMLVGEPPYTGRSAQAILGKLIQGTPVSAAAARASIPPNVDAALRQALARLPADRFSDVGAFARALNDPSFRYGAAEDEVGPGERRWRAAAFVLGAATLALAVLWASELAKVAPPGPTQRLSILLPEPQAGNLGTMALSSDGSVLVYEGPSEEGPHQLWLRRFSELNATPLPGTATGLHPSFSPDGREIAYMDRGTRQSRENRLMITSIEGGVPRVLHPSIRGYPHWGSDGYVYYMDVETGGISRIPPGGGPPETITERQEGERTPHYSPHYVAAGEAVLFVVDVGDTPSIRTADLSSGEVTPLVPSGVRPHYLDTGHLVYLTPTGELVVAPFDGGEMRLTGPGVPVAHGLEFDAVYSPVVLAENGTLIYASAPGARTYQPVWVDRSGAATPIDPEWGFDPGARPGLSLSPDGTRLAVSIMGGAATDVWVKELPAGPMTRLTFGAEEETHPRWIPDGRVSYVTLREGPGTLHARAGDGSGAAEVLLSHDRQIREGILSADGEWLIARIGTFYSVAGAAPGRDVIGIRRGRDTEPMPLLTTGFDEKAIMLSPDERWLAYESDESGRNEIYVRPFPDVDAGKTTVSVNGGAMPLWSRSGDAIFYVNGANEMVEVRVGTTPTFTVQSREVLFAIGPDLLMPQTSDYTLFDITPDDERFVILRLEEPEARELILVTSWMGTR